MQNKIERSIYQPTTTKSFSSLQHMNSNLELSKFVKSILRNFDENG
jgi:hypothetical protein